MNTPNNGGPAFPATMLDSEHGIAWNDSQTGMTLRQYAAIQLRVPESGTDWLDDMIRESLRDDLAANVLQGFMVRANGVNELDDDHLLEAGKTCYRMADAMRKAREGSQ